MKRFILLLQVWLLTMGLHVLAQAKSPKANKNTSSHVTKKVTQRSQDSQLGTNFSFEAASVRGKYQSAGQGIAMVEDEKVLDDLLGLRRSFKDRETQEKTRR
jgi:hypothetical protein